MTLSTHELTRYWRIEKKKKINDRLDRLLPRIFRTARLVDLHKELRDELLGFDYRTGAILFGPVATGKSHALAALSRYLIIAKHKHVIRITYEMLCLRIRDTYKQGSNKTELDIITPLIQCDCLIIEDLGSAISIGKNETDFSVRTFFVLLDSRLEACRPTFISTNKTKANLINSFDERIGSRLGLFKWIGVGGSDKRKEK